MVLDTVAVSNLEGSSRYPIPIGNDRKPFRVELTSRDQEVLEFILDMKFASAEEVFNRFFKTKRDQTESSSLAWTKKRLMQLERAKFLKSEYAFVESKRYFVVTLKGFNLLRTIHPEVDFGRPCYRLDIRVFIHDKFVLYERLRMEFENGVTNWISDRRLRSQFEKQFQLNSGYIPDAIYTNPSSQKVAFEVEIARKKKSRYRDKIKKYVQLMRDHKSHPEMFQKVHYLCFSKAVADILRAETKIYGEFFEIEERSLKANPK